MRRIIFMTGMFAATAALAQVGPSEIWGMIYNAVFPTLADKQVTTWQSTSAGRLNVTGLGPSTTCGTGVIDLSAGCSITIALGLGQ